MPERELSNHNAYVARFGFFGGKGGGLTVAGACSLDITGAVPG